MTSAILFDCDGVLVDSEILAVEVETDMLGELGLEYDHHEFKARFMGMSDKAFFAALNTDSIAQLGKPLPPDFAKRCGERLYIEVGKRLTEVTGARNAVLAWAGAKAVASSSTDERLARKLKKTALFDLFEPHIYSADHVTHAKPAPDLFLYAAKALDVAPADCLVIEDSVNGVTAGLAAGMRVWAFTGGGHFDDGLRKLLANAGAERVVADWNEATALFAKIRA
jgi:beta-phosphoglucomutase-like phosphatase (HAD superfamily)